MAKIIHEIRVEVAKPNLFQAIVGKQGDYNSRFLKVTLVDGGEVIGAAEAQSVTINANRPDGTSRRFIGEINEDGTVTVPLAAWMLELEGTVYCDISVIGEDDSKLTSASFMVKVEAVACPDSVISEDDHIDELQKLLEDTEKALEGFVPFDGLTVKAYVDEKTAGGGGVSKEYVDEQDAALRADIDGLTDISDDFNSDISALYNRVEDLEAGGGGGGGGTDVYYPVFGEVTYSEIEEAVYTNRVVIATDGTEYACLVSHDNDGYLFCSPRENGDLLYWRVHRNDEWTENTVSGGGGGGVTPKKWEHIATITVAPNAAGELPTAVLFSTDSDGNAFELTDFYVRMLVGATDGSSATFGVNGKNADGLSYTLGGLYSVGLQATLRRTYLQYIYDRVSGYGRVDVLPTLASTTDYPNANVNDGRGTVVIPTYAYQYNQKPLNLRTVNIYMQGGTSKTWIEGSTFELYGVRK